jgi:hypothetical protein
MVVAAVVVVAGSAGSAASKSAFHVIVGEATVSGASNGLTLTSVLPSGSFDVAAKTASGFGFYEVRDGTTVIDNGTFTLTRLVAFQFYGCGERPTPTGPSSVPPDFCGGRALFAFHATSSSGAQIDGLYKVNCQIHDPGGQAPPGTSDGVKTNARGVNFNKHITGEGDNVFIASP